MPPRLSTWGSVLLVGSLLLLILGVLAACLLPVVECPACIGWRTDGTTFDWSLGATVSECRYCKSTARTTLLRTWLITRKEGRPCYYMTHDE